jgi:ribosome maturation factor RimP
MGIEVAQIKKIVQEKLKEMSWGGATYTASDRFFLVDVQVTGGDHIQVQIDHPKGVTFVHCEEMTRYIESCLNRDEQDFELEVSSYSVAEPFVKREHYLKNMGRSVEVLTTEEVLIFADLISLDQELATFNIAVQSKKGQKVKKEIQAEKLILDIGKQIKQIKLVLKF